MFFKNKIEIPKDITYDRENTHSYFFRLEKSNSKLHIRRRIFFYFFNQSINMKTLYAEFISPLVSKLHYSDPTINSVCLTDNINNISFTQTVLSKFKLISCGETISINEEESFQMKIISILIDNKDLFSKLDDLYSQDLNETNIDHYLDNLIALSQIPQQTNFLNYTNILDFISTHFYLIDKSKIKPLPKTVIYSIISNPNLKLESEDSLFEFIIELFENTDSKSSEIIPFFEQIEFENLSEEKFIQFLNEFNPSDMTVEQIEFEFTKNKRNGKDHQERYAHQKVTKKKGRQFEYDGNSSHAFCGIIDFLTRESGGNVADNGTVRVTSLCHYMNRFDRNVVDLQDTASYFQANSMENIWLKFDFVGRKVHPTRYSIRTREDSNSHHPRSWVIEGSNTDSYSDWTVLDNRRNDCSLNGISLTRTFDIKEHEGSYRYLRFRQTGRNSSSSYFTAFSALEYFGTLVDE